MKLLSDTLLAIMIVVALLASAWIEIAKEHGQANSIRVALLASAWIEIISACVSGLSMVSRTPRECVD